MRSKRSKTPIRGLTFDHGFDRIMGGNVRSKRVTTKYKSGAVSVVKMQQTIADSPVAKRMVEAEGPEMLALMRTFQVEFGAKLLWMDDGKGEVGKRPEWADEPR